MKDAVSKKRMHLGEKSHTAKLKKSEILEIRGKYKRIVYSRKKLALEYGVSERNIRQILDRSTWKHV